MVGVISSDDVGLPVLAEDLPQDAAGLTQGGVCSHGIEDGRHEVLIALGGLTDSIQSPPYIVIVALLLELVQAAHLSLIPLGIHPEQWNGQGLVKLVVVDAHDSPLSCVDLPLIPIRALGDFVLEVARFDGGYYSSEILYLGEDVVGFLLIRLVRLSTRKLPASG